MPPTPAYPTTPNHTQYDVIIIGGAIMGASTAWWLTQTPDFNGRVLVIERDMSLEACSTAHTNSCVRQQFSTELNVRISQFTADFVKNIRARMGGDTRIPSLSIRSFGYMYLADTPAFADVLRDNQKVQHTAGAATQIMTPDQIRAAYPFYNVDDIVLGSINLARLVSDPFAEDAALDEVALNALVATAVRMMDNVVDV
ncbi:MAG: FAD-dependent oxidoreductase, partial [Paracoccaceae bacterium]